jgi:DNA-binding CsgD family transcriptional regulator
VVLLAQGASTAAVELADRTRAAIVLEDAPRTDFLFEIKRSAQLQLPSIEYLVGHAARLWKLPPQQARVLFYNLWSHSDREIAVAIGISVHTVQDHQNGLRRRTGVRTKHGYLRCLAQIAGLRPPLEDK